MNSQLESALERRFYTAVRRLGGRVIKLAPIEKGTPDRLVMLPGGRLELVELKTDTGRLSPKQKLWHSRAAELDVHVTVIYGARGIASWVADRSLI